MNEKYRTAGRLMRLSEDRRWEPVGPGMAEGKSLVLGGSTSIAFAIMTAFHARPGDRIIADESAQELTSRVNGGSLRTALEEHLAQHHPERDPDDFEVWIVSPVEPGEPPTVSEDGLWDIPGGLVDALVEYCAKQSNLKVGEV